jgi:hypothetical protein
METLKYAKHSEESHQACLEDQARLKAGTTVSTLFGREAYDHQRGDCNAFGSQIYQGSASS